MILNNTDIHLSYLLDNKKKSKCLY